jgi:phosphoribosyl 1,2-cyclic phosphodiesterase
VQTCSLQSGSNGNCIYVEAGGTRLLIDAGISARLARRRLARHNRELCGIHALFLSHGHGDHVCGAAIFQRVFGVPVYATPPTARDVMPLFGRHGEIRMFWPGDTISIDAVRIHTIPSPHDVEGSVLFVIEHAGRRLGVFTDFGQPFAAVRAVLPTLDALYLESNYEPHLLATGPYPPELKARISGRDGHLSNEQAAELLLLCDRSRLRWAALAHLSAKNNSPDVALQVHRRVLGEDFPLWVAGRYDVSPLMPV